MCGRLTRRCIGARVRRFCRSHLRVVGTRTVIWRVPHTEDLQVLVVAAVWHLGFIYPCVMVLPVSDLLSGYVPLYHGPVSIRLSVRLCTPVSWSCQYQTYCQIMQRAIQISDSISKRCAAWYLFLQLASRNYFNNINAVTVITQDSHIALSIDHLCS
jgi:hypothetical protein